jgi:hypothetical protein
LPDPVERGEERRRDDAEDEVGRRLHGGALGVVGDGVGVERSPDRC